MFVVSFLLALVTASSLFAQATVTAPSELRAAPRGAPIATVRAGTDVRVRERRGAFSRVTLEGFIHRALRREIARVARGRRADRRQSSRWHGAHAGLARR
jgi:hypothetical protein